MIKCLTILFIGYSGFFARAENEPKVIPHVPSSACLDRLKTHSVLQGWGKPIDGQAIILGDNYTVDYGYSEKAQTFIPVLTKIDGDSVTVVTPNGTVQTTGGSCRPVSTTTSLQMIANWVGNSDKTLQKIRNDRTSQTKKERLERNRNLARIEQDYKAILELCAGPDASRLPSIQNAARIVLGRLNAHNNKAESQPAAGAQ